MYINLSRNIKCKFLTYFIFCDFLISERKHEIKTSQWDKHSEHNELDETVHQLQNEFESEQQSQLQEIKATKANIVELMESYEELQFEEKKERFHVCMLNNLYKDFPEVSNFVTVKSTMNL